MGQIINWLRRPEEFAFLVLDFGTNFDQLQDEFPPELKTNTLKKYLDVFTSQNQHFVLLGGNVTVKSLKELLKTRFDKFSEAHIPYIWKSISFDSSEDKRPTIDVLVDDDDDGRAMIFHSIKNTSLDPYGDLKLVANFLGEQYASAYSFLGKK